MQRKVAQWQALDKRANYRSRALFRQALVTKNVQNESRTPAGPEMPGVIRLGRSTYAIESTRFRWFQGFLAKSLSLAPLLPLLPRALALKTDLQGDSMKKQKGFSLIELLIVVAIILIIAAIAIPNLLRSRMAANEASAVGSLRTINTAEVTFSSTYGIGYTTLLALATPATGCATASSTTACLIDSNLGGGTKSGYIFTAVPANGAGTNANPFNSFNSNAGPVAPAQSGQSTFCSDESGVIRRDPTGTTLSTACATSGLAPLQ
jgi:type IV pilus assembly protein PilA